VRRWLCALLVACAWPAQAAASERLDFPLRGKTLDLTVYRPAGAPKGTIVMGSGDVGWVGLGVSMAEFLSARGYIVIGVNVRQYLSVFTDGRKHLEVTDPPADFAEIADLLRRRNLLREPVIVSGVSEGAALAILVGSSPTNHQWIRGVITMGVPPTAELAWRWTDFTSWITKTDVREPSFSPGQFVASVSPLPIVMLQSTKDEFVTEADYTRLASTAREPKKLVLIAASNHRFTDRMRDLEREYLSALDWIAQVEPRG
jgi:alpha-beta hydrolase superfamily lysophospholipase